MEQVGNDEKKLNSGRKVCRLTNNKQEAEWNVVSIDNCIGILEIAIFLFHVRYVGC